MNSRILTFFTRTPLHVGAGASVGAIDQPIQRERHTGFPIIPATGQKGSFADQWPNEVEVVGSDGATTVNALKDKDGKSIRLTTRKVKEKESDAEAKKTVLDKAADSAWLFGSDTTDLPFAGSLIFSEGRVLAFPIRSAKGSYAWITCPLMLQRAARDGVFGPEKTQDAQGTEQENTIRKTALGFKEPVDGEVVFQPLDPVDKGKGKLDLGGQVVLEEYCFKASATVYPTKLAKALADLVDDALFKTITDRLVILSNGMMSHFATTACEIAQHVRINDETGTHDPGGLFNQENVPADTLFYAVLSAKRSRVPKSYEDAKGPSEKSEKDALTAFSNKVNKGVFQFGGDASTGLGFCSVSINIESEKKGA